MQVFDTHTLQVLAIGAVMVGASGLALSLIDVLALRKPYMARLLRRHLTSKRVV